MITPDSFTIVAVAQILVNICYIWNLPKYSYLEKKNRELDTTMLVILHSPTIFLLYGGFAPEYLIGFSLVSALAICHKTTTLLSNFVILVLSLLTHSVPIIFIILEAISMLQSASTLKFYNPKLHSRTSKQLAAVFLLNSVLYLYIALVLLYYAGYLHDGNPYYPTASMRVVLTLYAVFKFGTIVTAFLKQPIYELLPLGTVASISALTLSLVPIVVSIIMSAQIASASAAVFLILTNFMSFWSLYNTKTIKSLLLFTTVLSNMFVFILFIL